MNQSTHFITLHITLALTDLWTQNVNRTIDLLSPLRTTIHGWTEYKKTLLRERVFLRLETGCHSGEWQTAINCVPSVCLNVSGVG